jgi:hypothetical protein
MPTIPQLPSVTSVNADDELPIQQNGVTSSVTVSTLLASTQPALLTPSGTLLGNTSLGAASPQPIGVGSGLTLNDGTLAVNFGTTAGTAAAGNDPRLTGALQAANNLSDLTNAAAARTNLGLGTMATQNAGAVAISGGTIGGTDVSLATAEALATTTARSLAARFADRLNIDDFGLARDGKTDDSAKFAAAVAAAQSQNKALYIPAGGPILLAGAAQITLDNVALIGDGGVDFGYPYGTQGSQIWITATSAAPFLIGASVLIEGLCFYWPEQVDQPGAPIAYPPLFLGMTGISAVADVVFRNNQVTNAYIFFQVPAATTVGDVHFLENRICALSVCFDIPNAADIVFIHGNFFSWGVFQGEVLHYGGGQGAVQSVALTTSAGVAAGATQIPVTASAGVVPGMQATGNAAIPPGTLISAVGSTSVTLSNALTAPLAQGAGFSAVNADYYLKYAATTESVWLRITGNGSAAGPSSTTDGGPIAYGNFVFGYRTGVLVDGGTLSGSFIGTHFDSIGNVLRVINGGTVVTTRFSEFSVYGYLNPDSAVPLPLFEVIDPAPIPYESSSGADFMLAVSGMEVGFCQGPVFVIKGDDVYEIKISNSKLTRYSHGAVNGPYPALLIDAPNGRLTFTGNDVLPQDGGIGLVLTAIQSALIASNHFAFCSVPIDVETASGQIVCAANASYNTWGASALATGLLAATSLTLGGTPAAGGTLTLTASGGGLASPLAVTYTVQAGDTPASVAAGLAALLAGETSIAPGVLSAPAAAGATTLSLYGTAGVAAGMKVYGPNVPAGTVVSAVSGNTVTLSAGLSALTPANTALTFAGPLAALGASFPAMPRLWTALHPSQGSLILYSPAAAPLAFTVNVSSGAGLTATLGTPAIRAGANLLDAGNGWDRPNGAFAPLPRLAYSYQTPASGATVAFPPGAGLLAIGGGGTLGALTIDLPPQPADGEVVRIATLPAISSLSVATTTGAGVLGAPGSLAADSAIAFVWLGAAGVWARLA